MMSLLYYSCAKDQNEWSSIYNADMHPNDNEAICHLLLEYLFLDPAFIVHKNVSYDAALSHFCYPVSLSCQISVLFFVNLKRFFYDVIKLSNVTFA